MLDFQRDIHSLSDFKRHTVQFLQQLKETGQPLVLTINGRAELVVQDARSYQRLMELAERLVALEAVHEGLREMIEGKPLDLGSLRVEVRKVSGASG